MDQSTIDIAVSIATRAALNGRSVQSVEWAPSVYCYDDPEGQFIIVEYEHESNFDSPPWDI